MNTASKNNGKKASKANTTKRQEVAKIAQKASGRAAERIVRDSVSKQAADVMMSIVSPGLPSEVRFASSYTTGLTSVAQLKQPLGVRFGSSAGYLDTQYSSTGFVFRDPVRNAVLYDGNPAGDLIDYEVLFLRGGTEIADVSYYGNPGPMKMSYARPTNLCIFEAHGQKLGVGQANGNKNYIWSQANYTWAITQGGAVTRFYHVYKWTPKGETFIGQYTSSGTTTIANLQVTGYIRFEIYQADASNSLIMNEIPLAQAVALKFSCTGPVFRHLCVPEYESKSLSVEKVRTLAQGFLFTNTTPAIARGGKIATKQLPGDEPWYEYALNGYDAIALLSNADLRDASNGEYAFLKPTTISDLEMTDNVDTNSNGQLVVFGFDLDTSRAFLGYYAVLPTDASQSAQFTPLSNLEFESDDQWYQQAASTIDPKVFDEAIHSVAHVPQYDENPLHVKDIMNKVKEYAKKIGDGLVKYGPTAIEIGSALAALL